MVVPQHIFGAYTRGAHLVTGEDAVLLYREILRNCHFELRSEELEANVELRQPIPYIMVQNEHHDILVAQRTVKQGEHRLWGKNTLGVGGHIKFNENFTEGALVYDNAAREYQEETGWEDDFIPIHLQGILIRNIDPVDKVHVGLFFHHITDNIALDSPEAGHHNHRWMNRFKVRELFDTFEGWSQIVIDEYLR